jgi:uncharacterized protein YjbI with pentapeptide repeats
MKRPEPQEPKRPIGFANWDEYESQKNITMCSTSFALLTGTDRSQPLNQTLDTKHGELTVTINSSKFDAISLAEASFKDVNLKLANFTDVNLTGSSFSDVSLAGATFNNVDLSNAVITDANLDGMRINGILVTELLRVYGV